MPGCYCIYGECSDADWGSHSKCYAAKEDAKIRFDFGEGTKRRQGPVVELPATGGEWVTVDAFTMKSDVNGWRRTVLNIVAGKPDLNYFTITVEK